MTCPRLFWQIFLKMCTCMWALLGGEISPPPSDSWSRNVHYSLEHMSVVRQLQLLKASSYKLLPSLMNGLGHVMPTFNLSTYVLVCR